MLEFYNDNREEFLSHYHKRSNVETTFHMIKSKFGQRLRSKTLTGTGQRGIVQSSMSQPLRRDSIRSRVGD